MSNIPVRIVVVEDQGLLRDALRLALEIVRFDVRTAKTGAAGIEAIAKHQPALALIDLRLPDMTGFHVVAAARKSAPACRFVATSGGCDPVTVYLVGRMDFHGFVWKENAEVDDLVSALVTVRDDHRLFDTEFLRVQHKYVRGHEAFWRVLSPTDFQVLSGLARGLSDEEIAEERGIKAGTVKDHLTELRAKTKLPTRVSLVHHACKIGLGIPGDAYLFGREDGWMFLGICWVVTILDTRILMKAA